MSRLFSPTSFAAGIILGAVLGGIWTTGTNPLSALTAERDDSDRTEETAEIPSGAIEVSAQPAGSSVTVDSVTVPPPGVWVAVHDSVGGRLGNVLGAARVAVPKSSVVVPLLRRTEPGERYAIQLYRDNGDGAFDLSADSVYVDLDTGTRVVAFFEVAE